MQIPLTALYMLASVALSGHIASARAESEPDLLDLDLATLMTIKVGPSADASAKGLSQPYAGNQVATGGRIGILTTQNEMDTPFSFTNYTQSFIQNHQAASIGDVLQYDPAVRMARGFGNFQQVYLVRGLPIFSDDMTYNGLYGILPRQYLAAELIERVEVLYGANTFLNGAAPGISGCLGGAIDVIPKRAPKEDLARITLGLESASQGYIAADLAQRSDDGQVGVRFNVVERSGDTAVTGRTNMNSETRNLNVATLGADYRGIALRVSADVGFQDHRLSATQPSITIASNLAIPNAPDADSSIAQPWTYSNARDLFGTLRAEYDFSREMTGWIAAGARHGHENSVLSAFLTVNDSAGDYSANRFDVIHEDAVTTGELGFRLHIHTQHIEHQLTISASGYQNDSRNAYVIFNGFDSNIYHPSLELSPTSVLFAGGDLSHPRVTANNQTASLALADEVSLLNNRLQLTLGARQQLIREENFSYDSGTKISNYDASQVTPMAAAVYKLSPQYSVYSNYIEGLLKGEVAPESNTRGSVSNGGQTLKPYQTRQLEIGLKYDANSLGATLGVFNIRKPLSGYNANNALALIDQQHHWGIELSLYGKLPPTDRKSVV